MPRVSVTEIMRVGMGPRDLNFCQALQTMLLQVD